MSDNHYDDQSEDGELQHSPEHHRASGHHHRSRDRDYSVSEEEADMDSLDIKPPQASSSSTRAAPLGPSASSSHKRSRDEGRRREKHGHSRGGVSGNGHGGLGSGNSHRVTTGGSSKHHRSERGDPADRDPHAVHAAAHYTRNSGDKERYYKEKSLYDQQIADAIHHHQQYKQQKGGSESSKSSSSGRRHAGESSRKVHDGSGEIKSSVTKVSSSGKERHGDKHHRRPKDSVAGGRPEKTSMSQSNAERALIDLRERLLSKRSKGDDDFRGDGISKEDYHHRSSKDKHRYKDTYENALEGEAGMLVKEIIDISTNDIERKHHQQRSEERVKRSDERSSTSSAVAQIPILEHELTAEEQAEKEERRNRILGAEREMARQKEQSRLEREWRERQRKENEAAQIISENETDDVVMVSDNSDVSSEGGTDHRHRFNDNADVEEVMSEDEDVRDVEENDADDNVEGGRHRKHKHRKRTKRQVNNSERSDGETSSDNEADDDDDDSERSDRSDSGETSPVSPESDNDLAERRIHGRSRGHHKYHHRRSRSRTPRSRSPGDHDDEDRDRNRCRSDSGSRSRSRTRSRSPFAKSNGIRDDHPGSEKSSEPQNTADSQIATSQNSKSETEKKPLKKIDDDLPPYYPAIQGCRAVEEFMCLNRIEEGTYGVVYRAQDKRTDEIVALKKLKMEKEKEGFPITSLREINTLLKGQHPNIVTVREIVVGSHMDKIFIVMDYVEHDLKSLMETMRNKQQMFTAGEAKCLLRQLLAAVAHLHDNWILHRDLKTSNLLLSHKGILKVGDFGLAREYGSPLKAYTPIVVTLWYRAPELLLCTKEYSTPIDMWSVGCIFAEFLLMNALFPGKSEVDQLNRIFKDLGTPSEKIWPGYNELPAVKKMKFAEHPVSKLRTRFPMLTDQGEQLLSGFLTYDPSKRLTAETSLRHEYFAEVPLPIDPAMFPTWPAKSELGHKRAQAASPKPPSGGREYKQLGADNDDNGYGFRIGISIAESRRLANVGGGFSLKF